MDETEVIRDILDRIDKLMQHIIDIKATMYRQEDFRSDAARIYDQIQNVQVQLLANMREAVLALENQIKTLRAEEVKESLRAIEALKVRLDVLERPQMARWLVAAISGAVALGLEQIAQSLFYYFQNLHR